MRSRSTTASDPTVLERLRGAGLRPTRQRLALARLLFGRGDRHVTAEALFSEAKQHRVNLSLATVYNALHDFTGKGLLREIVLDSNRSCFDTNTCDHHHFYSNAPGGWKTSPPIRSASRHCPKPLTVRPCPESMSSSGLTAKTKGFGAVRAT